MFIFYGPKSWQLHHDGGLFGFSIGRERSERWADAEKPCELLQSTSIRVVDLLLYTVYFSASQALPQSRINKNQAGKRVSRDSLTSGCSSNVFNFRCLKNHAVIFSIICDECVDYLRQKCGQPGLTAFPYVAFMGTTSCSIGG
jgi:hypothetical protein